MNIPASTADFSRRLLQWFDHHGRKSLPWQANRDPYHIWISEIMLQQTQVTAVIPYFQRFIQRFPSVESLAESSADDVMHHWSGLGYYARARNLHKAAKIIIDKHHSQFPQEIDQVIALPGIGRSTAGAILAFCFNQRHPILDGNVKRVLTRFFAVSGYPGQTKIASQLWQLADETTPDQRIGDYTQAVMDLGSILCTRSKPRCDECPLHQDCAAFAEGSPTAYPTPKPKNSRPERNIMMLLLQDQSKNILLMKRPPTGIWGGLWSLPELPEGQAIEQYLGDSLGLKAGTVRELPLLRHGFTHFELLIKSKLVNVEPLKFQVMDTEETLWYDLTSPQSIGLPAAINKLLSLAS